MNRLLTVVSVAYGILLYGGWIIGAILGLMFGTVFTAFMWAWVVAMVTMFLPNPFNPFPGRFRR